jgi:hypothetical protein
MEILKCQECGKEFKFHKNSTIKPKLCLICYNKSLLRRSNLSRINKSLPQTNKYSAKNKSGLKRKKTDKEKARNNADTWFSRYIRCKYNYKILADGTVICKCFISGAIKEAKKIDNGHCFSRKFLLTRYEEDNCRPQNRSSNRFSGEADHYKFRDNLLADIGEKRFNRLDELRKQEGEDTVEFYFAMANKYRNLVNDLVNKLEIKKWW